MEFVVFVGVVRVDAVGHVAGDEEGTGEGAGGGVARGVFGGGGEAVEDAFEEAGASTGFALAADFFVVVEGDDAGGFGLGACGEEGEVGGVAGGKVVEARSEDEFAGAACEGAGL